VIGWDGEEEELLIFSGEGFSRDGDYDDDFEGDGP
jgi:hypothetical protein